MKRKKVYVSPQCSLTRIVLERGLCATSGVDVSNVNIHSESIEVKQYSAIGDADGFNDINFN